MITKNGRPIARWGYKAKASKWFGADEGTIEILGDIISPIDVEWEAMSNPDRVLNP